MDPSQTEFVFDAFPAYTYFDNTKKVMCDIAIVGGNEADNSDLVHTNPPEHEDLNPLPATVSKLTKVAADANETQSQENQDMITLVKKNNSYVISVEDGKQLNSFTSTNPAQGKAEWVGLVVNTGVPSILGINYDGQALTETDVEEAASVDVGDGNFILWVKYGSLPKTFTLSSTLDDGYDPITITIKK